MKLFAFTLLLSMTAFQCLASDKIILISGDSIETKIISSDEFKIVYKAVSSDSNQIVSKKAVSRIDLDNGNSLKVSDKITVGSRSDWEKVVILIDQSQTIGLKKISETKAKTTGNVSGYVSGSSIDKASNRKILEDAAEMGCPFIYIPNETSPINLSFSREILKRCIFYTYN